MTIETIGAQTQPAVGNNKKKSDAGIAAMTGLLAGGATGYFVGEPMSGIKLAKLDADKFEKGLRHPDKMNANEKKVVEYIKDNMKTKANFSEAIDDAANEYFEGKKEMSVQDFIKKSTDGKSTTIEGLTKQIANQESYAETVGEKITHMKDQLITANDKVPKTAEELIKKNEKIAELTNKINDLTNRLGIHNGNIAKNKEYLEIANLAKEGNISQSTFASFSKGKVNAALNENIAESAKYVEKYLPKVNSLKKAGIYGGITAAALFIGYKFFGKKPEPQVAEQPTNS